MKYIFLLHFAIRKINFYTIYVAYAYISSDTNQIHSAELAKANFFTYIYKINLMYAVLKE